MADRHRTTQDGSLTAARCLTPEDERKIAAYDAARATVKIEGNTRAFYVLRAEAAEARIERALSFLEDPDYSPPLDGIRLATKALRGVEDGE